MSNVLMGMLMALVKFKSSFEAAGMARQTNSKSDALVLSFRPILPLAEIQKTILYITFYDRFNVYLLFIIFKSI